MVDGNSEKKVAAVAAGAITVLLALLRGDAGSSNRLKLTCTAALGTLVEKDAENIVKAGSAGVVEVLVALLRDEGHCPFGESCRLCYAQVSDADANDNGAVGSVSQPCKHFQRGRCTFGKKCKFQHVDPKRSGGTRAPGNCIDFLRGNCMNGDACKFRHGSESASSKNKRHQLAFHHSTGPSEEVKALCVRLLNVCVAGNAENRVAASLRGL